MGKKTQVFVIYSIPILFLLVLHVCNCISNQILMKGIDSAECIVQMTLIYV